MDVTHIHLAITHFPIIGTLIGIGILAYGIISKNDVIKQVALATFIVMAIASIPVFLTGEEAEETVEHIAGISENLIEEHEELAEKAIWLIVLMGLFSLVSFIAIFKKLSFAKITTLIVFFISIATFGLFAKVGNLGGQIRHSEIRGNTISVQEEKGDKAISSHREDDDDDD